jgi:hypothetical protein
LELSSLDASLLVEDLLEAQTDEDKASRILQKLRVRSDGEEDEDNELEPGFCELCERGPMRLTFHHLFPRKTHRKMLKRGLCTKEDLIKGALICRPCHSAVHRIHDHETLALEFNNVDNLKRDPEVVKWIAYARKQKVREK